ncbi:type II TA system antitoxin MqsA family protein [Candidatus Zixiibacteriota bacterium]
MRGICPNCEQETELNSVRTEDTIVVRGESIKVPVEYYECKVCGADFEDPKMENGPVDRAYREYRRRKGLLLPEEIRQLRSRFGLTQSELGKLLGFGGATLSRYENGALQDEAHDRALRLALNPGNLIQLVHKTPDAIPDSKRDELTEKLIKEDEYNCVRSHIERVNSYNPDELSGFKGFEFVKFLNAVLLFCKEPVFTTVLNKLLFYSDFLHFKKFAISITGTRYVHMQFGPVPDEYRFCLALLESDSVLETEEVIFDGGSGAIYISKAPADLGVFDESELRCLLHVKSRFEKISATDVSQYSHNEPAYKETKHGDLISYVLAESLSLDLD